MTRPLRSLFWGVFQLDFGQPIHVAPCHMEELHGVLDEPHTLSLKCSCQPELQGNIVVHNRIQ